MSDVAQTSCRLDVFNYFKPETENGRPDGRFLFFTAMKIQVQFLWVVKLRDIVIGYQRFGGSC